MDWLRQNGFWIVTFVGFFLVHLFGHGAHGGHGGRQGRKSHGDKAEDEPERPAGHQH